MPGSPPDNRLNWRQAPVAQWIEHEASTFGVGGSSPSGRANRNFIMQQSTVQTLARHLGTASVIWLLGLILLAVSQLLLVVVITSFGTGEEAAWIEVLSANPLAWWLLLIEFVLGTLVFSVIAWLLRNTILFRWDFSPLALTSLVMVGWTVVSYPPTVGTLFEDLLPAAIVLWFTLTKIYSLKTQ